MLSVLLGEPTRVSQRLLFRQSTRFHSRAFCTTSTALQTPSDRPHHAPTEAGRAHTQPHPHPLPSDLRGEVPESIWGKTNRQLHATPGHPLNTLRVEIENYVTGVYPQGTFDVLSDLSPIVSSTACFDDLLVPSDHPSRSANDTYYLDAAKTRLLRTHMTAHDSALLRGGSKGAICTGDVFRRDTIDRTHYPVFHQVDAFRLYSPGVPRDEIEHDLKQMLLGLAQHLFGNDISTNWQGDYFPFTEPSFELEVQWNDTWLELLGCGLLHRDVLTKAGVPQDVNGWAFGLGLERIAMVLFNVPDIRLFWSRDERFSKQFKDGDLTTRFTPFSNFPKVDKHISFWVDGPFHENDFCHVARAVGGDLVESVEVIDQFEKKGRASICFNVTFRSLHRNLTHVEVNQIYNEMRNSVASTLPVTLR